MTSQIQLQARIEIPSGGIDFAVQRDSYPARTCTIAAGGYYLTGEDDSEDVLKALNDAMAAGGAELGSQYDLSLTADYLVGGNNTSGGDDVTWTFSSAAAQSLADDIGIDSTFTISAGAIDDTSETGAILPPALWRPDVISAATSDFPLDQIDMSQSQSQDRKNLETLVYSIARGWRLEFGCVGSPLASVENEYHWLRRFWLLVSRGYAFRYYRDETVSAAYNPNRIGAGYSTLKIDASAAGWDLQPIGGNFMREWRKSALCWEVD